ncbi:DHS-like NAD/FAD-binding domain-containing protein, partial [Suillus occidentalis]
GAGISVSADIPDFCSPKGLFTTKTLSKDLLDANTISNGSSLCKVLAEMHQKCSSASPTAFYLALKILDEQDDLHHVYIQNIDLLELRAGLSYGVSQTQILEEAPRCILLHSTLETLTYIKCYHQSPLNLHISTLITGYLPAYPTC